MLRVVSMSIELENSLCDYMKSRAGTFKKYLLAALDNKEGYLRYLESSEGQILPNADLKNCEFLRDVGIFKENTRVVHNGRTTYKLFSLTGNGKKIAQELKAEGISETEKILSITQ